MINGIHVTLYSSEKRAEELRAFLRDTLKLPFFDAGGGWLIFTQPGEIGCHPDDSMKDRDAVVTELGFPCKDLEKTMTDLKKRGVTFEPVKDEGWGRLTHFKMPGGLEAILYEPRYAKPSAR